ncbi:hypothetical protein J6590_101796 [Homalodisca vitripennis]|nr:hypothetical protein J6590_101796 [Homalodisca vitripennis]
MKNEKGGQEVFVVVCCVAVAGADDKWVWGDNSGRDGLRGEHSVARPLVNINVGSTSASSPLFQSAKDKNAKSQPLSDDPDSLRYEVFEGGNGAGPNDLGPRPPIRPPTQYPGRPIPSRPSGGFNLPPPRPSGPGGQFNGRPPPPGPNGQFLGRPPPPGPGGPPRPDLGVLTGPVPSWEKPLPPKNGDPTSFDSCKCVNSFNCKSPGLKFGNCDVGKVYCCFNNPGFGIHPSGSPGAFGSRGEGPAVLAGPNGPVDKIRPDFYRPQGSSFPDEPFFNRPPPPPGAGPFPFDDFAPRNARRGKSKDAKN